MKTKLFLIEGCDGAGKSTVAKEIAEKYNADYVHLDELKDKDIFAEYLRAMALAIDGTCNVVMDRCWLSEPVYAAVFRNGYERMGQLDYKSIEEFATQYCDVVVIFCNPPLEVCLANIHARANVDQCIDDALIMQVWNRYQALPISTSLKVIKYNYQEGKLIC